MPSGDPQAGVEDDEAPHLAVGRPFQTTHVSSLARLRADGLLAAVLERGDRLGQLGVHQLQQRHTSADRRTSDRPKCCASC